MLAHVFLATCSVSVFLAPVQAGGDGDVGRMSDAEYYKELMSPIDFGADVNDAVAAQEYNIWSWQDLLDKGDADEIKMRILQWAPSLSHPEMLESGLPLLDGVITATDKLDDDSALHLVDIIMDNVKPRWAGYDAETVRRTCMEIAGESRPSILGALRAILYVASCRYGSVDVGSAWLASTFTSDQKCLRVASDIASQCILWAKAESVP
ncbi:Uncharacterized protein PBTT_07805 [Plasmodiophora brassicae]|uniref:Uncharacterized protein n=1 Tax=Plasmodiophora brassicae TaxID=37360 RepID=A0A0G4J4Q3_PLABS|nr:hypothetical protein PBRA_008933 [Plasmodiophora brassicae]